MHDSSSSSKHNDPILLQGSNFPCTFLYFRITISRCPRPERL
jgi:hypothetical protein